MVSYETITANGQKILDFIHEHRKTRGRAPSRSEIQHHFGFSSLTTAQVYVKKLARLGAIKLDEKGFIVFPEAK